MSYHGKNILVSLSNILLLALLMQVSGARPTRWWDSTKSGDSVDASAGLCSLAIAPRGYQCEEHQV